MYRVRSDLPWFNFPGVVAAYQPVTSPDPLSACMNVGLDHRLAGLYTATPGVAPTWTTRLGWKFNGTTQYLNTGVVPSTGTWSLLVRVSNQALVGGIHGARTDTYLDNRTISVGRLTASLLFFQNGGFIAPVDSTTTSGVFAVAGQVAYLNGVSRGALGAWSGTNTQPVYIGALNAAGAAAVWSQCNVLTAALYSRPLSAAEMWLASQQMAYCDVDERYNAWAVRLKYWVVKRGATAATQSVAGVLSSAGVMVKAPCKVDAGAVTSAGAMVRAPRKVDAGAVTSAGAIAKRADKPVTGAISGGAAMPAKFGAATLLRRQWKLARPPLDVPFEVNYNSSQAAGLVAWWPTVDSAGQSVLRERTGRAGAGLWLSATQGPTWTRDGARGQVLSFDGAQDGINLLGPGLLGFDGAEGAATVWLKEPATLPSYTTRRILYLYGDDNNHVRLSFYTWVGVPYLLIETRHGGTAHFLEKNVVVANWIHFAVTWSAASAYTRMYVNGARVATHNAALGTWAGTITLALLGCLDIYGSQAWSGVLSEPRIYGGRQVTDADVWQMYDPATRWDLYRPVRRWWTTGIPATVAGGGLVGTTVKQIGKPMAGALTEVGSITKQALKGVLAGVLSSAGVMVKRADKVLAGAVSAVGTLIKLQGRYITATLSTAGAVVKRASKNTVGTLSTAGGIVRRITRSVGGTLSFIGTLAWITGVSLTLRTRSAYLTLRTRVRDWTLRDKRG